MSLGIRVMSVLLFDLVVLEMVESLLGLSSLPPACWIGCAWGIVAGGSTERDTRVSSATCLSRRRRPAHISNVYSYTEHCTCDNVSEQVY